MKKFPRRTRESDSKTLLAVQALQRSPNAGQNFMLTVVTTDQKQCFLSLSGARRQQAENELRTSLHWLGQLDTAGRANRGLRKDIRNLGGRVGDLHAGAHHSATAFHPHRARMVDPNRDEVIARGGQPLTFQGNRDCAEPKALHAAAESGAKINGMTTVWFGNGPNPYPDQAGDINGVDGLNFANPCNFCSQNETRIMIEVERTYHAKRGVPLRSYEV